MNQAFYFIGNIELNDLDITDAVIRAYNGNILVGERKWSGSYTDIPAMGYDGRIETAGYCEQNDNIDLKIVIEGVEYDLNGSIPAWSNNEIFTIENLSINDKAEISNKLSLVGAFPNPFNPSTVVAYQSHVDGDIDVSIYNLKGQMITSLYQGYQTAGYHEVDFDASDLSSGMYFVRITNQNEAHSQKILLMK